MPGAASTVTVMTVKNVFLAVGTCGSGGNPSTAANPVFRAPVNGSRKTGGLSKPPQCFPAPERRGRPFLVLTALLEKI